MSKSKRVIGLNPCMPRRLAATCSVIAVALASSGVFAQEAQTGTTAQGGESLKLDEVVVTARKRAESIDTVPLSITAMPAAKIEERNLKSLQDVAAFTPGFYTQQNTGTGTGRNDRSFSQLTFRGIGANSTNVGPLAGGTAFLDGAPVLNASLSNLQDLERVEVLKGPQSVYFGRATFIGAINYITKDPTDKWTARITQELGQHSLQETSVGISGALVPDVASFRLAYRHYAKDGQYYTDNQNTRLGDQRTDSISITGLIKPIEGLKIRPFFNHFEDTDGPGAQYVLGGRAIANGFSNCNLGGSLGAYYCGQVPQRVDQSLLTANLAINPTIANGLLAANTGIPTPFYYASFLDNFGLKRKADQASNKIEYTFDNGTVVTAVSAYHQERIVELGDLGFRATPTNFTFAVGYKDYDWSQELRVTSSQDQWIRYTAGVNYVKLKQSTSGIPGLFGPFGLFNAGSAQIGYTQAQTPSAFAGLYIDVLKPLTLSLEARYQSDKISGHYATSTTNFVNVQSIYASVSPRISLDYKITPTAIVYVLASDGYKPGGFNQGILTQPQFVLNQFASTGAAASYGQEKLVNYEGGIKGSFLDGKLRTALTGYYGKYRNAQVPVPVLYYTTQNADGSANTNGPFNTAILTRNVGLVDLKGAELEAEAIVLPGFRIGGTFAYTGTKIRSYYCGECSNIIGGTASVVQTTAPLGKRLPGAPKISYTFSTNYEHSVFEDVLGYIGADYIYRGTYFADAANIASSGASKTVNVRLGAKKGNYTLELFARNLFDNQSPSISYSPTDVFSSTFSGNTLHIGLPDRRRVGVRASATF